MKVFQRLRAAFAAAREAEGPLSRPTAPPTSFTEDVVRGIVGARPMTADARFARCVAITLKHEGGFVDHPSDPGGATNHGISLRYARSKGSMWDLDGDGDVDRDDILLVTPEKAAIAYRSWFWNDVRGDDLWPGLDLCVFDFAVNSGPGRAIKAMQAVLEVEVDGVIGPKTMAAIRAAGQADVTRRRTLVFAYCEGRRRWLHGLKTWPTFGRGWTRRVMDINEHALGMTV